MNFSKNLALWVIIAVLLVMLFNLFQASSPPRGLGQTSYSDFLADVDRGGVADVTIQGSAVNGHFSFAQTQESENSLRICIGGVSVRSGKRNVQTPNHDLPGNPSQRI